MSATGTGRRALRLHPPALAEQVSRQLRGYRAGNPPAVLVRAEPVWPHDPTLTTADGSPLRIVPCGSVLAIWEQLGQPRDTTLVLLTDLTERELGAGILTGVYRQKLLTVEPWDLVIDAFGAQQLDPRLESETWAVEALLDAMPPEGWPPLTGPLLRRDHALRQLAAARLRLDRLGLFPDDLDLPALLRWSALPGAADRFNQLRSPERDGLAGWLAGEFGRPAELLLALVAAGHTPDALPLGLVCAAAWSATHPEALRAQGRIEQYFGSGQLDAATVRGYADAATGVVQSLLRADAGSPERRTGTAVLDRAEDLLVQFGATAAAGHSPIMRAGFLHRADATAAALRAALADPTPESLRAAGAAAAELAEHQLAASHPHRIERAWMVLRLVHWLATPVDPPASVAAGVAGQIEQWSWVDLALGHAWTGEDSHPGLKQAFRAVYERVQQRRAELDQSFAGQLARWTAAGSPAGELLPVEQLLQRVIAPAVRHHQAGVLLVVVDGMSGAVAADLAEDLTRRLHWQEYDPLAGKGDPRRRAALAALPSVTEVSRASLFAGALRQGGAAEERKAFESHPLWRGRPARLFHKRLLAGGAGQVLGEDLETALGDPEQLVAVVINTVDDALDRGRESSDPEWRVAQVGPLRALLDHARYHGRAVIITSDHGHVTERDGTLRPVDAAASARHRTGPAPASDGEVELVGPRVVADQQRIIALWDPTVRYLPRRAGYHGGASLAELTIPVLAFLPPGSGAPAGWAPLPDPQPGWWVAQARPAPATPAPASEPEIPAPRRPARKPAAPTDTALFEVASPAAGSLVEAVLGSDMFAAAHTLTPRKVPLAKIRGALTALVDANGVLPTAAVARSAGEHPARAIGFVRTLQRIFNVDNYPVLSLTDDDRTVRLELSLLREQFGVPESRR